MPQQVLDPLSNYGRSGGILLLNPTDRDNKSGYQKSSAQLRSAPVIRGLPPGWAGPDPGATPSTATLTTLTPSTIAHGVANAVVTCTGTGFKAGCTIIDGGVALVTTFVSATSCTAVFPHLTAVVGAVNVTVKNPGEVPTTTRPFTYT